MIFVTIEHMYVIILSLLCSSLMMEYGRFVIREKKLVCEFASVNKKTDIDFRFVYMYWKIAK